MTDRPAAVISDANVLIDYIHVEETKVLRLVSDHLFSIKLPRRILEEVDNLTQDQAEALGIEIIEATYDQWKEAAIRGGGLSQPDKLCFAIARDSGWAIWTSDKPLHTKCKTQGIPAYWGLQLMLELCKEGKLDSTHALDTARRISAFINPDHIGPASAIAYHHHSNGFGDEITMNDTIDLTPKLAREGSKGRDYLTIICSNLRAAGDFKFSLTIDEGEPIIVDKALPPQTSEHFCYELNKS